jgi:hypothetical protein
MPKTVLVICSQKNGKDFPKEKNQIMLKQLLGVDYVAEFMGMYPEELPTDKKFDAVLFAGCNVISWLFTDYNRESGTIEENWMEQGMETLSKLLNQHGIVIFVENEIYIKKIAPDMRISSLSIPLNLLSIVPITETSDMEKQTILSSWRKFFNLAIINDYFVYKAKSQEGGKYKTKTKTTHKRKGKTTHKRKGKTSNKRKGKTTHKRKGKTGNKRK